MKYIAILGALQAIIFAIFLFTTKKNRKANFNLIAAVVISVMQMGLFIGSYELSNFTLKFYLKIFSLFVIFLVPPFFYLYVRFLVKEPRYYLWDLIHLLPIGLAFISVSPYFFLSDAFKGQAFYGNANFFMKKEILHMLAIAILINFYGILGYRLAHNYKEKLKEVYSDLKNKELTWLHTLMRNVVMLGLAGLVLCLYGIYAYRTGNLRIEGLWRVKYGIYVMTAFSFFYATYVAVSQPEIFRELAPAQLKKKYLNSVLSYENKQELKDRLLALMAAEPLFLNPNLKLGDLAAALNISNQLLSQLLNQHFQKNFYNFINDYRIEVAKKKLIDPQYDTLTIHGIAQESGFKSKSTFYAQFKNKVGLTPTQFQKNHFGKP